MSDRPGLFENGREANITSTITMVEDALIELGHFVNECREEPPSEGLCSWRVSKGSALVRISLVARNDDVRLRTVSIVMNLNPSVDQKKLFRRLLTINASEVYGAAFALRGSRVLLVAERSTLDLDRSEVLGQITRVKTYADHYDDQLVDEFGGSLGNG
ncbi:MAG: YbjN domain-containing protein [Myxococcota bacterium]